MPKIVVLGAGIGGLSMAYRAAGEARPSGGDRRRFRLRMVPLRAVEPLGGAALAQAARTSRFTCPSVLAKFGIGFDAAGARRVLAAENTSN